MADDKPRVPELEEEYLKTYAAALNGTVEVIRPPTRRFKADGKSDRTGTAETLTELARERGVRKKDIAERMGIDPTFLSQLLQHRRPMTAAKIEELVAAFNSLDKSGKPEIKPWIFAPYLRGVVDEAVENDPVLSRIMRGVLFEMTAEEREIWTRMSLSILDRHSGRRGGE